MNDRDREQWVDNDEGLYNLMRRSRLGKRRWIRENRALIDEVAGHVTSGTKRQHFMAYDPVPKWVRKLD
jgi:hypothetical protein